MARYLIFTKKTKNMRKIFITLAVFGTLSTQAQTKTNPVKSFNVDAIKKDAAEVKNYKPIKGTITAEFGLTGGLNTTNVTLNNNGNLLRFRYFVKNDIAARIGLRVSTNSNTKNFFPASGLPISSLVGVVETKTSNITANLGIEKHFKGSDRLSTYVGADLLISTGNSSEKRDNTNQAGTIFQQGFAGNTKGQNSSSGFGFRLVTGAEYYIVKNVYLGAELGFGFLSSKSKPVSGQNTTATVVNFVVTASNTTTFETKSGGKSSEINPSVITGIRIGYQF